MNRENMDKLIGWTKELFIVTKDSVTVIPAYDETIGEKREIFMTEVLGRTEVSLRIVHTRVDEDAFLKGEVEKSKKSKTKTYNCSLDDLYADISGALERFAFDTGYMIDVEVGGTI